jgi:tRNA modification GTPase
MACRLTPPGEGGISLIELSGSDALCILAPLFHNPKGRALRDARPGSLLYGRLRRDGVELDEVVVECAGRGAARRFVINCHGGATATRRVMAALVAGGARELPWREAQARDGRLDAAQREAAALLPGAPTLRGVRMLLDQYRGALSTALGDTARLLAQGRTAEARAALEGLLRTAPSAHALIEPLTLALIGRPNVGKSTLANALLRYDRMIVHPEPGTTRDAVEELLAVHDVPFRLLDTAGVRDTAHEVERLGVALSIEALAGADIVLLLFDASTPLEAADLQLIAAPARRRVPVLTKGDLPRALSEAELAARTGLAPVLLSAATGAGIDALEERIVREGCPAPPAPGTPALFTAGQEERIRAALRALDAAEPDTALREMAAVTTRADGSLRPAATGPAPGRTGA